MKDQNFQTRKEEYSGLYDRVQCIGYEGGYRWAVCHLLLKKNVWLDIIKIILEYPLIAALETLKEWKVAITSVGQGYKSTEKWHDYKMNTGITYGEQGQPMDIGKSNDNFKNRKPKCFNCNKYGYMAKECQSKKKDWNTRKCFKCEWEEHIAKDCRGTQSIKK